MVNFINTDMETDRQVTTHELQCIIAKMKAYNREDGFMAEIPETNRIDFFDSMPSFGGAPVKLKELEFIVKCRLEK